MNKNNLTLQRVLFHGPACTALSLLITYFYLYGGKKYIRPVDWVHLCLGGYLGLLFGVNFAVNRDKYVKGLSHLLPYKFGIPFV